MKHTIYLIIALIIYMAMPVQVMAAIHISASPSEGGGTLRLDRIGDDFQTGKAVRLRINSDEGDQYQVFQRMEEPLLSSTGEQLNHQAFIGYAVNGSNASGTLYAQNREPLGPADQLIFTSSPNGQNDTLTMAYLIDPARVNAQGDFIGRIGFTVRSLSRGTQDNVILPVTVQIKSQWQCQVKGDNYRDKVYLQSADPLKDHDAVIVTFEGNPDQDVKIYHQIIEFPVNITNDRLPQGTLEMKVADGAGIAQLAQQVLNNKRQLVFNGRQESQDLKLVYQFASSIQSEVKSGIYRGRMIVSIESSAGVQDFPLNLEIEIKPKLDIEVVLPPGGVRFSKLLPSDPSQTKEILVKVTSNTGRPYMVMQNVTSPLVNPKGEEIKKEHFVYRMEWVNESSGKLGTTEFTPVGVGEVPVFYSDRTGSSAEFKVVYRLGYYPGISAGDYGVPIVFSLGEM